MWSEPELLAVPVDGGELTVGRWGRGDRVVVASHGITANHRSFGEVAAQVLARDPDASVYAVDHRGRAGSVDVPGPYGLATHARDLVALIDHLAATEVVLVGHSMGAFAAAGAATLVGERVRRLVLADGALPIAVELPPEADIEQVVRSVIGPALDRLDRTFASPEEYVRMWREHPAVGGDHFTDVAEAYVRYDLVPANGAWRVNVSKDAVLEDGRSTLIDEGARTALERVEVPTVLLWAPRGLLDQEPGLYPPQTVQEVTGRLAYVEPRLVDGVNHYTLVLGEHGAGAVADAVVGQRS